MPQTAAKVNVPPKLHPAEAFAEADSEGGLVNMTYVYILQSEADLSKHYVGITDDPARRLDEHNSGNSVHTNKYRPWKITSHMGIKRRAAGLVIAKLQISSLRIYGSGLPLVRSAPPSLFRLPNGGLENEPQQ